MSALERWVLLGLARARVDWFGQVGQWATSAAIPAEFVRCVSVAEVRARVASGRPFSAALLDGRATGVDRDLFATLLAIGVAPIVVDDDGPSWQGLGAAAVLPPDFGREDLLEVLGRHATMVRPATAGVGPAPAGPIGDGHGRVLAVMGPGGTGASTVAIAIAQGLAAAGRGSVVLADLCRVADQAMLHDARVLVPGVQEVVEAHRTGAPAPADLRPQTFAVDERGYRLLLGLRRPAQWTTIRPQAFDATVDSLQRTFDLVVADIDHDLEGEAETGSTDIEDRNTMARVTASRASVVVVVGSPDMKGTHALVRTIHDLLSFGVPGRRIVPVVNRAPRSPRERAEIAATVGALAGSALGAGGSALPSPVFLPRRRVDTALRDGVALPKPLPGLLVGAVGHVLDGTTARRALPTTATTPTRVAPGSLGMFTSTSSQEPTS